MAKKIFDRLHKFDSSIITKIENFLDVGEVFSSILEENESSIIIFHKLLENKLYHEVIYLLALGLPNREVVWWAYLASLKVEKDNDNEKALAALTATRHWVYKGDNELRQQAKSSADLLSVDSSAKWAALAAFWSGDDIGSKNFHVKPNPFMANIAAANAISIACEKGDDRDLDYLYLFMQGVHIANEGNGQLNSEHQALILSYLEK